METNSQDFYGTNAITGGETNTPQPPIDVKQTSNVQLTVNTDQQQAQPETKQTDQTPPELTLEQQVAQAVTAQLAAEKDLKDQLTTKNINFDNLAAEYANNGKLSDKTMESLEKVGFPKSAIDAYITGMEAVATRFEETVVSFAGNRDDFKQLQNFVQSLGDSYVTAFNSSINSGDLNQIKMNVEGLKAQMVQKYGTTNPTLTGANGGINTKTGFSSSQEMIKAINDPRYYKDTAYTQEVQKKILSSSFIS